MKTKILKLVILLLIATQSVNAQYIKEYSKLPGQDVRFAAIIPVTDAPTSNIYICGNYSTYLFVGEFLQSGDVVWSRKVNLGDTSITINQMIQDSDGNLVIVGTSINGEFGRAFALKFNPFSKKVSWYQKATTNSFFWDVEEMGAGGDYVIGGQETGTGTGNQTDDITVVANRSTGTMTIISSLNKNVNESIEALVYNEDSASIYTTGRYELLSGSSKFRICLNKLDAAGNLQWTRSYIESTATSGRYYSEDMIQHGDTLLIVGAGDDIGTTSIKYLWLIKTDLDGNALLTNKYDITGATNDGLFSAIKPYDGGYIVYGTLHNGITFSDIFLFNINQSGSVNWAKSYPFSTRTPTTGLYNGSSMTIIGDNIFQVGEKRQDDGTLRGVLMKTSIATGAVNTCANDLTCTITPFLDNYDALQTLSSVTAAVPFVQSVPTKSKHTFNIETTCNVNGLGMETNHGELAVEDNVEFKSELIEPQTTIYPNPTTGIVLIQNPNAEGEKVEIKLYDITGQLIQTYSTTNAQFELNLEQYESGVYLITIMNNATGEVNSVKVVKR